MSSWYEHHVLPYLLDIACGIKPVRQQRQSLIPLAYGKVLEIGIGTGLNLEYYDVTQVERIIGLDPSLGMHRLAQSRAQRAGLNVELVGLSAEQIPFPGQSFDTVVVTYSLCTIPDPVAALKEMHRVLKRDGQLLFCEHGQAPDVTVRSWQDRMTPLWSRMVGGCCLNRHISQLIQSAGFEMLELKTFYLMGLRPLTYHYVGIARAMH
ncbi:class I SAM-dependent methyltransferase [Pseudomonas asuensis]|uniref:class I SAM-dependent methyltransferase n=1 Tax=Pseudomonas asuensis TaxID=1825787 RepID=UPI00166DBDD0|nr:class I SAM-dependent methyltransferase [Pseudomonas asuensis]